MAQIFPRWTNNLPPIVAGGAGVVAALAAFFFWYYGSPKYTDVGYRPKQPVPYSHRLHVGDLGMDCRYCHTSVEYSSVSIIPPTQTCMNCHTLILPQSEKLLPIRESYATGKPMQWVKVHKLPDYAYFNHSIHIAKGVGCATCHGDLSQMEVVEQKQPLSMGWCLDCHRSPEIPIRPAEEITNMKWTPPANQREIVAKLRASGAIAPPEDCSACHR
ncbi:MAG: cytochrome c3 family protein [Candidatus Zixiibacteriota bacterium]